MTQHDNPDLPDRPLDDVPPSCHSCGEPNPAGSRFCEHCGASLDVNRASSRRQSKGKKLGRRRANKEIASIANILKSVRALYIVLACIYGGLFLLVFAGASILGAEGAEGSIFVVPLLMMGSVMLFSILGAAFLYRNPLAWSLALSCMLSLDVIYSFYQGGLPILGCILVLICWSVTIKISTIRGLLEEFSDTVAAQKLTGRRQRVEGGELSTRTRVRAARARSSSAPKIATFVVGGVLVLALLILIATKSRNRGGGGQSVRITAEERARLATEQLHREQRFDRIMESFIDSWKKSDLEAIAALVSEGDQRTLTMSRFKKSLERYGFAADELPEIDGRRDLWSRSGPGVKSYFRLPDMTGDVRAKLRTNWLEYEGKWELVEVGLRKTSRD